MPCVFGKVFFPSSISKKMKCRYFKKTLECAGNKTHGKNIDDAQQSIFSPLPFSEQMKRRFLTLK
jgi:hypothetical protein